MPAVRPETIACVRAGSLFSASRNFDLVKTIDLPSLLSSKPTVAAERSALGVRLAGDRRGHRVEQPAGQQVTE